MKRIVRLTESDLKNIVKKSVGKVLREYGSDGPDFDDLMNRDGYEGTNVPDGLEYNELDASEDFDDFLSNSMREPGAYDRVGTVHAPNANDFDTNDELLGLDDDEPFDFESDDFDMDDSSLNFESKRRMGRIIRESINRVLNKGMLMEKHRPSGVSRRIHTRDANGKKQSFDYIPNLPKYNKYQQFNKASKFQRINARPVKDPNGEDIDTVLKDGTIERKGLHLPQGYYNVNNVGGTEHWGIDPKTFAKKYEEDPEQAGVYKPKGGPMMASNPLKRNTSFQAPWGGRMDMKAGSRILKDPNNPKDTYGIGGNEFDSTYKFDENRKHFNRIIRESINKVLN